MILPVAIVGSTIFSLAAVQAEVYRGFEKLQRTFREALKSGAVSFQSSSVCLSNPVQEAGSPESGLSYREQGNRAHVLTMQLSPVEFKENRHSHSHVGAVANSSVIDSLALEEFKVRWLSFSCPVMLLLWVIFSCKQTAARTMVQTRALTTGIHFISACVAENSVADICSQL